MWNRRIKKNLRILRCMHSKRQRKETVAQLLIGNGKMITDGKEKAEMLNS